MKKILIAGNWKMNTDVHSSSQLANELVSATKDLDVSCEVLICPPFVNLSACYTAVNGSVIKIGGQNCYYESKGAFTGEISPEMLKSVGCEYCIVGHSERRTIFGESDEIINKKVKSLLNIGIKPIVCIGETLEERNEGNTYEILFNQLNNSLDELTDDDFHNIVIAYEPVWAIGTGVVATSEQAQEAHQQIRVYLKSHFGDIASESLILYGGSMNEKNASELLALPDVNGGLIGGASLKAESFVSIIKSANEVLNSL